ncbi:MAG TPA: hypothetical protein DCQ83_05765 [Fibrobacteres bacterium]|jgi:hypothetical protein|nr:hypothetical protein [Fibrobacterota bacterium]
MKLTLNGVALRRIFEIWNVPIPHSEIILFALRGAVPIKKAKGWSSSLELQLITPDYQHLRCTLGLWNQKTDKVFAAQGSTVPHKDNVLKAAARKGPMKGRGTNQLEPGFYEDLHKGEHLQGKPMGHAALRQTGYRFYRRSHHAPPYTSSDPLYFGNPYDNLHSAWNMDGQVAGYRSSGCMVVAGLPFCPRLPDSKPNQGAWKVFHDLIYAVPQKQFPLLLLPATDVWDALSGKHSGTRLCYGSRGDSVVRLQKALRRKRAYSGRVDGNLGAAVYRAWNSAGLLPAGF